MHKIYILITNKSYLKIYLSFYIDNNYSMSEMKYPVRQIPPLPQHNKFSAG